MLPISRSHLNESETPVAKYAKKKHDTIPAKRQKPVHRESAVEQSTLGVMATVCYVGKAHERTQADAHFHLSNVNNNQMLLLLLLARLIYHQDVVFDEQTVEALATDCEEATFIQITPRCSTSNMSPSSAANVANS